MKVQACRLWRTIGKHTDCSDLCLVDSNCGLLKYIKTPVLFKAISYPTLRTLRI